VHLIVRKRLNYTFKRTRKRGRCDAHVQRSKVISFLQDVDKFKRSGKLAAVHECGFDQRCVPVYAYAPKGCQAIATFDPNTNDRTRVTMVMSIERQSGTRFQHLLSTPCNSGTFATFLRCLPFRRGTGIILDNASVHKTILVRQVAQEKGYALIFTPPYTPEANPIEMVFGVIKNKFYKLRYESEFSSTYRAVEKSLACAITPRGIMNTFQSATRQAEALTRHTVLERSN